MSALYIWILRNMVAVLATLTAAAPILVPAIGATAHWTADFSKASRRSRLLDNQNKVVQFWCSWLKALDTTSPNFVQDMAMAQEELRRAADAVSSELRGQMLGAKWSLSTFNEYREGLSAWRRAFLLYHQPNHVAQLFRAGGYVCLSITWFGDLLAELIIRVSPPTVQADISAKFSPFDALLSQTYYHEHLILTAIMVWGVVSFILYRYISVRYETQSLNR